VFNYQSQVMSERNGGRGRGDDRDRRRRRDRDRTDRDFDRPRRREREDEAPIQGPVVLLKRPGNATSSNSNFSLSTAVGSSSQPSLSQHSAREKDSTTSLGGRASLSSGPAGDHSSKPLLLHRSNNVKKTKTTGNSDGTTQSEGSIEVRVA